MHSITFNDIAAILNVTPVYQDNNPWIETLLTDSRKLSLPDITIFFAISSPQRSSLQFVDGLYQKGVRCFVIDSKESLTFENFPEGNFIEVENVILSLQQIVIHHRNLFNYPVIGITGSNGKTIVKEWLYQLLNADYNIVRNPKSYNSQIGVPLSVWNMNESNTLAIFEAGISQPGEMTKLEKIIKPDIGVFTFAGGAHAEGFQNLSEKINEKLIFFSRSKLIIYCADEEALQLSVSNFITGNRALKLFSWSRKADASLRITEVKKERDGSVISCIHSALAFDFFIPFTDEASIHNAITCCCVLLHLQVSTASIATHFSMLRPIEMRLELKEGINNCSLINDGYSADINSLIIALNFLAQQHQHKKQTVILSDILESGYDARALYQRLATILAKNNLFRFIGIGTQISSHKELFENIGNGKFFSSTDDFLEHMPSLQFNDETILLKGARVFRFERISNVLEQKMHETLLEINLNALRNNLAQYTRMLGKNVKLMAMVKAFSYGSGSFEIASLLEHAGIDYLAVAYTDEGVSLRKSGVKLPIMVLNTEEAGFHNIIKYGLEPELYSFNILAAFNNYLLHQEIKSYPVHLKLDTGMNRLGFLPSDIKSLLEILSTSSRLKIISVFSHLAASDEPAHDDFTSRQASSFLSMSSDIEKTINYRVIKHIANTSAIHRHPSMQFDMVRLGIGLYGVDKYLKLQNVTTLKTSISQLKHVKKEDTVGYSRKATVTRDSKIAVVRIGYADGYPRSLSNGVGKMFLNGNLVPVIGNICMDMTMLDITGVEANENDEVIVFGEQLPVTEIAVWAETIPYEILTNISQRVKRVYYEE